MNETGLLSLMELSGQGWAFICVVYIHENSGTSKKLCNHAQSTGVDVPVPAVGVTVPGAAFIIPNSGPNPPPARAPLTTCCGWYTGYLANPWCGEPGAKCPNMPVLNPGGVPPAR